MKIKKLIEEARLEKENLLDGEYSVEEFNEEDWIREKKY